MARNMKDSGIEWIGMIPEGWEVCRLKNIVACHDELRKPISADKRENHLKLYDYYGASGVIDTIDDYNVDGTVLLIGEDGANLKLRNLPLIYRASGKFWVNNHAHILIVNKKYSYDYVAYLLEAGDYSNYITGSAQPKLSQFNLMRFPVAIPNYTEQENISFFIHRECSKIDSILSETRSSIEEYKKLKQAVITQAVTEGTPAMFSSPHSVKLKYLISIVSGEAIRNEQLSDFGEYPVYGGGEIIGFCSQYNTSEGSLIIGRVGARCGCVTHTTCKSWATDNALIVLPTCNAKYMYYVIGHCQLNNLNTSNAQPLITSTKIKNVVVPYFSDAMQQQEIADYLDAKCAEIDGLIAKKEQLVKELESYKKSLIYEVVTGKREV